MAGKCKKCDSEITQSKDAIKCSDCSVFFHLHCAGFAGDKRMSTRKPWKCEGCAGETLSNSSRASESGQSVVLEAIAGLRKDVNDRLDKTNVSIENLRLEVSSAVKEVGVLKNQVTELKGISDTTVLQVTELQEENRKLVISLRSLQNEVAELQQHSRKNNLIISGVPVTPRENIYTILETIARVLDLQFYQSDISATHRLPVPRGGDNRPPSIVVCFVSRAVKQMWLTARRNKRTLSARELHGSFPDSPVYINDHLAKHTGEIFNAARKLVKEKKLEAVWTSDGRVLAKKAATANPFRIRDLRHVRSLDDRPPAEQREGDAENRS